VFDMKRREFITLRGGTAAWPLATRPAGLSPEMLREIAERSEDGEPRLRGDDRGSPRCGSAQLPPKDPAAHYAVGSRCGQT
jgi:hypothetical protein